MADAPTVDSAGEGDIPDDTAAATAPLQARSDHSPWNWLLILPILVPLLTPLFNRDSPRLFGFPAFYWMQLAFIIIGVSTTGLVYQMTKRSAARSAGE